jgi:hypothetical protein
VAVEINEKDRWELATGMILQMALGPGFTFRHTGSDTADKDGVIDFDEAPHFAIEITRCESEDELEFLKALGRGESGPLLALDDGSGGWIAALARNTRLNNQSRQGYQVLVDELNDRGWNEFEPELRPGEDELIRLCLPLGVTSIRRFVSNLDTGLTDFVYRHPEIDYKNTFRDTSVELVAKEMQSLLNTQWLQLKATKLVERSEGLPSHLVLLVGSKFSESASFTMRGFRSTEVAPKTDLVLPNGICAAWLVSLGGMAICFQRYVGWTAYDTRSFILRWNERESS